ncbi:uncharacterized protein BCR38DRAFT_449166 [Pseudomassariella vexata]|uniref:Cyclin-like domain-containing protein n=1 Tax=Pseudomassariella vexata TaxID=1141098 RepID=A0A1Y2DDU4_9PEZI|nr:uncharacterized protein BCR38DRAFT_449166 [Pseudomassariella vexata]ORY57452.1 hypothetical protein BCR38DRAFT_449166 [Pseudomassariella vexata]
MSSFFKPNKTKKTGFVIKPKGAATDRLRDAMMRIDKETNNSMRSTPGPESSNAPSSRRRNCPNTQCTDPYAPVQDGYCSACGREIDTSNIVSEVQFGETSSGAAMVQGSFVAADQGTTRNMGPGMRRIGGMMSDTREKTIREAKMRMQSFAQQLRLSDNVVNEAVQIFKLCLGANWIQGRGLDKVIPVCFFAACRRQDHCRVMMIDMADLVKINVFEIGHVWKQLDEIYDFGQNQIKGIMPEDLIYRFAEKLDFGDMTNEVATLGTRYCQRMGLDWMVTGRRPSGICGACLLMAARQCGFRRSSREVVYVVKVTMATIEQRLEEFRNVGTADLTVEDFLKQELLETRHDPPAFYKHSAEWQEKEVKEREKSGRKRRRVEDIDENEEQGGGEGTSNGHSSSPRATPVATAASREMPPPPLPPPDTSKMRQVSEFLKKSADPETGAQMVEAFDPNIVPPRPPRVTQEVAEGLDADDPTGEEAVDHLAETYAEGQEEEAGGAEEESSQPKKKGRRKRRKGPQEPVLRFTEEWVADEEDLEKQIEEVISDPSSSEHSKALATAAHLAHIKAMWARSLLPDREISMEEIIDPSEFADDPEVENCKLSPEEADIKEVIWLNTNKDWLRKQQEKEFRKQMEELGPPKKRRNRIKRPRIGEGQLTPASTPGEAAVNAMKKFAMSKRINFDAISGLFQNTKGPGSAVGSSQPASEFGESEVASNEQGASRSARNAQGEDEPQEGEQEDDVQEEEEPFDQYENDEWGKADEVYDEEDDNVRFDEEDQWE